MKKFLCAILTSALLLTSVIPAFAAGSINVSESKFSGIMSEFGTYMPSDPVKRVRIWTVFKAYMLDGTNGIDTLISALNGESVLPADDDMQIVFNEFVNNVKANYKDQFIFFLKLYKQTALTARKTSLNNFDENPLEVSAKEKEAADALFAKYVNEDTQAGLEYHGLGSENFMNLLTPFNGCFKMTSDKNGDFVLATYKQSFAKNLAKDMSYSSINGVTVKSSGTELQEGFDILTGVVAMFNTFSDDEKENLKVVLAHDDIELYESGLKAAERPTTADNDDDDDSSSSSSGGSSGSIRRPSNRTSDSTFTLTAPTYNTTKTLFSDLTEGSWEVPYVMNLTERKIFVGYEDGSFRPNINISRQEIAVALVRAMGLTPDAEVADAHTGFTDDADVADWARGYVNIAVTKNLFTGYDDGEFKPTRTISRQELITVIMRLTGDVTTASTLNYTDVSDIGDYAKDYVGRATTLGIVGGYPDGSFRPLNDVTRAEAAKMLYNGLEYYTYLGLSK